MLGASVSSSAARLSASLSTYGRGSFSMCRSATLRSDASIHMRYVAFSLAFTYSVRQGARRLGVTAGAATAHTRRGDSGAP